MLLSLALGLALRVVEPPLPDRPDRGAAAGSASPSLPSTPDSETGPAPAGARTEDEPVRSPVPYPPRPPPRAVTLLGAGALGRGGATWLTQVGYSYLAVDYAQGVSAVDDLGGSANFTWTTSEMLLAANWRRELVPGAESRLGARVQCGAWLDFGSTWIYPANRTNGGLQAIPGVVWTLGVAKGFSASQPTWPSLGPWNGAWAPAWSRPGA